MTHTNFAVRAKEAYSTTVDRQTNREKDRQTGKQFKAQTRDTATYEAKPLIIIYIYIYIYIYI